MKIDVEKQVISYVGPEDAVFDVFDLYMYQAKEYDRSYYGESEVFDLDCTLPMRCLNRIDRFAECAMEEGWTLDENWMPHLRYGRIKISEDEVWTSVVEFGKAPVQKVVEFPHGSPKSPVNTLEEAKEIADRYNKPKGERCSFK